MQSGQFDGSDRDDFFQGLSSEARMAGESPLFFFRGNFGIATCQTL
jgi:hypothetical protein